MVEKMVKMLKEVDSPEQAENVGVENVPRPFLEDVKPPWRYRKVWWGGGTSIIEKLCWEDVGVPYRTGLTKS